MTLRIASEDEITGDIVDRFWTEGYLAIDALMDAGTLAALRRAYDDHVHHRRPADGDRLMGGVTRQIMYPSENHETFAANRALDAGLRIAERLLRRADVRRAYDMLVDKPPRHLHPTPWHQDAAYWELPMTPAGAVFDVLDLQFWVALDQVDEENGCMCFVPGRHRELLLAHHVAAGDPTHDSRMLEISGVAAVLDLSTAISCPLSAGGCTIHLPGTPHYTGPNRSADRPRRAYVFNVSTPDFAALAGVAKVRQLEETRALQCQATLVRLGSDGGPK